MLHHMFDVAAKSGGKNCENEIVNTMYDTCLTQQRNLVKKSR